MFNLNQLALIGHMWPVFVSVWAIYITCLYLSVVRPRYAGKIWYDKAENVYHWFSPNGKHQVYPSMEGAITDATGSSGSASRNLRIDLCSTKPQEL